MSDSKRIHRPTFLLLCGGVRLLSLFFFAIAFTSAVSEIINAFVGAGHRFSEIPDVWYGLTFQWWYTWEETLGSLVAALVLWFANRPIARWCTPKIETHACMACGYDLKNNTSDICPECGDKLS